jgi:nucleotidyltransferase/DNA polymerase involved in DNA repair
MHDMPASLEGGAILLLDRVTGSRAASTNGLSEATGSASLLVRKTLFLPISSTFEAACEVLQPIIEKVWRTCDGAEIRGRTVTLKVNYADFEQITRSRTSQALFSTRAEIEQLSDALLEPLFPVTKGIRLLGITLSSLGEKHPESEPQLSLSILG